jgi:hypothetical protein
VPRECRTGWNITKIRAKEKEEAEEEKDGRKERMPKRNDAHI